MSRTRWRLVWLASVALAMATRAADLWDERGLRIIQTTDTNFPPALLMDGVREGAVRAVLQVDPDGRLLDCLITGATHPVLVAELLAHVRGWKFEAPRQRGEPVGARAEVMFTFEARGQVVSIAPGETPGFGDWTKTPLQSHLGKLAELDAPLGLLHVVQPQHPGRRLQPPEPRGTASVDFYIDVDGRPRMPVVTRASHQEFGYAAAAALAEWRFAPPTRGGRPVIVRAVQQFTFSDAPPSGSGAGPVASAEKLRSAGTSLPPQ